jgi:hypothetical protein
MSPLRPMMPKFGDPEPATAHSSSSHPTTTARLRRPVAITSHSGKRAIARAAASSSPSLQGVGRPFVSSAWLIARSPGCRAGMPSPTPSPIANMWIAVATVSSTMNGQPKIHAEPVASKSPANAIASAPYPAAGQPAALVASATRHV